MTDPTKADHLSTLLEAALVEADVRGDTLVSALLAECIAAAGRGKGPRPDLP